MFALVQQANLKAALEYVRQPGVTMVALNAKGNSMAVTSMTGALTLHTTIPARVEKETWCSVAHPLLLEVINSMQPEGINLSLDNNLKLTLEQGRTKNALKADQDFQPAIPHITDWDFSFSGETLSQIGRYVSIAAGVNDARQMMNGVNWTVNEDSGIVEAAATDGYRLAVYEAPMERKPGRPKNLYSCLIPAPSLALISGRFAEVDNVNIKVTDKAVLFDDGVRFAAAQRIESGYFDYKAVIPQQFSGVFVANSGDEISRAIRTIRTFAAEKDNVCVLKVQPPVGDTPGYVSVHGTGDSGDAVRGLIGLAFIKGDWQDTNLNFHFLDAGAKAVKDQPLEVKFSGFHTPVVLGVHGRTDYQYVIMPMRLD